MCGDTVMEALGGYTPVKRANGVDKALEDQEEDPGPNPGRLPSPALHLEASEMQTFYSSVFPALPSLADHDPCCPHQCFPSG